MLEFHAVSLRHSARFAIEGFDLAVGAGSISALVGPSGCGKSTMLRLAAGLLVPDAGRVVVCGQQLDRHNLSAIRHRIGFVLQEGGLFPHLTARDNVTLMARHLGWSKERINARLDVLLPLTRLPSALLDRYPVRLSGGERQRVSLARALMLDPDVLLLDEPLGALDPIVRHDLQRELRDLFARLGKTVLLVTHDVAEAGYLARELVLMRAGSIVQRGTLADLVNHPVEAFVSDFVGAQRQLGDVLAAVPP